MGKPTISMAIFNSYVKLPEGIYIYIFTCKYVEGGPDHKAPEVVWNTSSIRIYNYLYSI